MRTFAATFVLTLSCVVLSYSRELLAQDAVDPNAARLAAAQADKAVADAEKAAWDAKAAASEAATAAATAKAAEQAAAIGTVTASGVAGTVEVKDGAGKGPATILASQLLSDIAQAICDKVAASNVVLYGGNEDGQFSELQTFNLRKALLVQTFDRANQAFDDAKLLDSDTEGTRVIPFAGAPMAVAGAALSAAANLASYFRSDYTIGDIALTPDDGLLVAAVAGKLREAKRVVRIPSRLTDANVDAMLLALFSEITSSNDAAAENVRISDRRAKDLRDQAAAIKGDDSKEKGRRTALTSRASKWEDASASGKTAIAGYQALTTFLFTPDTAGSIPLAKVIRQKRALEALGEDGVLLFVKAVSTPAGYYTKKNLWTSLGGMPYYIMGGQVATFAAVKADGTVQAAGTIVKTSGFLKASAVVAASPASDPRPYRKPDQTVSTNLKSVQ